MLSLPISLAFVKSIQPECPHVISFQPQMYLVLFVIISKVGFCGFLEIQICLSYHH
ncbi:hypothetical protein Fmac_016993 [Flemingia macrophylla]|uniref:Uncharacterized protein n=1 Tax=Flemingia macrophylla TaxID=520843 RepID=A0ABD1ML63_9FABA